ncbi:MAG: helix-turn-helix domain-containing protein [Polyangiales bacterium]
MVDQNIEGTRRVAIVALPGAFTLDVLGAFEIFHAATRIVALRQLGVPRFDVSDPARLVGAPAAYEVELVGADEGKVETLSGITLFATRALANVPDPVDTLVIAGGDIQRMLSVLKDRPELSVALRRIAQHARRVVSVCTGSFVLAALGLLDGKRATSHWAACELLQKRYAKVRVEHEPIFTQDGSVYTSAGATTGMDLSLALIRQDHGHDVAREIARWLVLYVERNAGQAQLSAALRGQAVDNAPLRELVPWIAENIRADLGVAVLAARVGMSIRNFARAFKRETGITPATYVESLRVEVAQRKLEMGSASIAEIADEVGFGSIDTLRRAFVRQTGRPPSQARDRKDRLDNAASARHS